MALFPDTPPSSATNVGHTNTNQYRCEPSLGATRRTRRTPLRNIELNQMTHTFCISTQTHQSPSTFPAPLFQWVVGCVLGPELELARPPAHAGKPPAGFGEETGGTGEHIMDF